MRTFWAKGDAGSLARTSTSTPFKILARPLLENLISLWAPRVNEGLAFAAARQRAFEGRLKMGASSWLMVSMSLVMNEIKRKKEKFPTLERLEQKIQTISGNDKWI
jgi:hypothetical protein